MDRRLHPFLLCYIKQSCDFQLTIFSVIWLYMQVLLARNPRTDCIDQLSESTKSCSSQTLPTVKRKTFSPSRPHTARETIKQLFTGVIKSIYECDGARAPLNTNEQLHLEKNRGSSGHSGLHKAPIVSLPEKAGVRWEVRVRARDEIWHIYL